MFQVSDMARLISPTFAQHKPLNHSFIFPRSHPDISKSYQARSTPLQDHGIGVISINVCAYIPQLGSGEVPHKKMVGALQAVVPAVPKTSQPTHKFIAPPPFTSWPVTAHQPLSAVTSPVGVSTHSRLLRLLLPRSSKGRRGSLTPGRPTRPSTDEFQFPDTTGCQG